MPLRLDIKRKLTSRSDRIKSVELHPTEPWVLLSIYCGKVHIHNYETQTLVKQFEINEHPVRASVFVARKNWVVVGSDDTQIRVFNYNTMEKVVEFEAHTDYIRSLAVHPTQSFILSSSDDFSIKLWDWEKNWACAQVFEGHGHYVMQVVFNPKDTNTFASASLDRTIRVWQLGSSVPNFTLEGHEAGVNSIDYYPGGEKPYIVSGADDRSVKVWDYQTKACMQTLDGHSQNVTSVKFHPEMPIIISASEDGTVRLWHSSTYRLETTLNYGMERAWCAACRRGSNLIALGYDEGSIVVQMGREEPAMSMDVSGKVVWSNRNEIMLANLKAVDSPDQLEDGEPVLVPTKELGTVEELPQKMQHNPNGRFVAVMGDGEYTVYTAVAWRNMSYGVGLDFVWSDKNEHAVRDAGNKVKISNKTFKERTTFKPDFSIEALYGGPLLGARSATSLAFYEWETTDLIRRIEITARLVIWSEDGTLVAVVSDESFYVLRFVDDAVAKWRANGAEPLEDGIEDAFDVIADVDEIVKTGIWVGDCFVFTNSVNRLCYFVGGEIVTVAHVDRPLYLLGYIPAHNRVYLADRDHVIVSYHLSLQVLEYQTVVMRGDHETAMELLPSIPESQRARVAMFLQKQGFKELAIQVTNDPEQKFELAMSLGQLETAIQVTCEMEGDHTAKWKTLADMTLKKGRLDLAEDCLKRAQDYGGLLLLYSSAGHHTGMLALAEQALKEGKHNINFVACLLSGGLPDCINVLQKTGRFAEAAFMARTYAPSMMPAAVAAWRDDLAKTNPKAAQALADPAEYANLFPELQGALQAEQMLAHERSMSIPANAFPEFCKRMQGRDVVSEAMARMAAASAPVETVAQVVPEVAVPEAAVAPVAAEADVTTEMTTETTAVTEAEPVVEEVEAATVAVVDEAVDDTAALMAEAVQQSLDDELDDLLDNTVATGDDDFDEDLLD